jgi:hypothetical protein
MYSMKTFLYKILNNSKRNLDPSKIFTLGPLSDVLARITIYAQEKRNKLRDGNIPVYREIKLTKDKIDSIYNFFQNKKIIKLIGY